MKVSKFFAVVLSVMFFIDVMFLISAVFLEFFPGFSFFDNQIVRIVLLLVVFGITNSFYGYIYGDLDKEDIGNEVIYGSNDLYKKIIILIVAGFFISMICLFIFMNL
ncbi:hypothetical protein [Methanobrevibacter cuticularis]|nr:hypothetical protein [Methanobrevibacter cuticularis]